MNVYFDEAVTIDNGDVIEVEVECHSYTCKHNPEIADEPETWDIELGKITVHDIDSNEIFDELSQIERERLEAEIEQRIIDEEKNH